jgi:hypothetical protein
MACVSAREDARIPLFYAAFAVHSDEFALAAIEEMLRDQRIRQVAAGNNNDEENTETSDETSDQQEEEQGPENNSANATLALNSAQQISSTQQAQLTYAVGTVLLRIHRLSEALGYFQAANSLERNTIWRTQIAVEIRDLRARLRRQQINSARQPILHAYLEQDHLVRAKLAANAALPLDSAVTSGETP